MTTQVIFDTYTPAIAGTPGTGPTLWSATTDQTEAVITTAGAFATYLSSGIFKVKDVLYVNYDVDGTPGQNVYTVTSTSSGSLVTYPNALGGALLAANNLSDVAVAATARTNLGLGTGNSPTFTDVILSSVANALTAHAGGGQGSALALTARLNRITTVATAADSVKLPAATAGKTVVVVNAAAANAMAIFPSSGEVINALSADASISVSANKTIMFFCAVAGTWNSILTA